jgi:N-hydroxyarylamine O-acetyltransferase
MNLTAYLERIGFVGAARADFDTLRRLHRAHLGAVPFENLDVQLRRPLGLEVHSIFEKIVHRRRGGWCYEQNGLLGWALGQIGFDVERLSAAVMRESAGDAQFGSHLCLLVRLERPYFVDVGFGGSLLEPLELRESERIDTPYRISLRPIEDGYWRFVEQAHGAPFSFDFKPTRADESVLARRCSFLQTDAASPFIQNMVVQRRLGATHVSLRGRVLTPAYAEHADKMLLNSANELVGALRDTFGLDVPEAATLWPAICARHEALFGTGA